MSKPQRDRMTIRGSAAIRACAIVTAAEAKVQGTSTKTFIVLSRCFEVCGRQRIQKFA